MIIEAGVTNVFRTVLIIVGTLALFRFIGRLMIAKRAVEAERASLKKQKAEEKEFNKIKNQFGKTKIVSNSTSTNIPKINPNKVEDVDFEEIE